MAQKCRHEACDQFSRKLTGAEIRNLEKFNLSKEQSSEILHGTIRGLCPHHAALELADDFSMPKWALRAIEKNWDTRLTDNFADAYEHAQCSSCSRLLSDDRAENTPDEVRDILTAYEVPEQRVDTIVYLQSEAIGGKGRCFTCCLRDPKMLTTEPCDADNLPELQEARAKREASDNSAIRAIEGEFEREDEQRKALRAELSELQAEIQDLEQKTAELKAEIHEGKRITVIAKQALKKHRDRAVGAYKLCCEIEGRRLNEANISKYEESTDLLYLDREANGWWELIHTAEAKGSKARPSQTEPPSEPPSETTPLSEVRERAITAYRDYRECVGRNVDDEALKMIENSTDVEMLTANTELYTDFTLGD